jgi:Aspartyl protease/PDZ domain
MVSTINAQRSRISRGLLSPILFVLLFLECSSVVNGQSHIVDSTLLVEGSVNTVPAVFLLDTGAEHSALDKHFVTQIGLNSASVQTVQHPFRDELSGSVWVRDLWIQSIATKNVDLLTTDLIPQSRALGEKIDGVLGVDLLRKYWVTIDYAAGMVKLDLLPNGKLGRPVKLHSVGDQFFVPLRIQGKPMDFLLDTGTDLSVMSYSGWLQLNRNLKAPALISGIRSPGSPTPLRLMCVSDLEIESIEYKQVPMRVLTQASLGFLSFSNEKGLLGSDFLKQFMVELDLGNETMFLRPNPDYRRDNDRFSSIGIQFLKDASGPFVIMAVWTPSPAAAAGMKTGDRVVEVNGASTAKMNQNDFSQQLHGPAGQKVTLRIKSGKHERYAVLTIKNLLCQPSAKITSASHNVSRATVRP